MLYGALVYNFKRKGAPSWNKQRDAFLRAAKLSGVKLSIYDSREALRLIASIKEPFDFVYLDDYDPYLAHAFSGMGIRVFNNAKTMEITHDLALLYLHLAAFDVPYPKFYASMDANGPSLSPLYDTLRKEIKDAGLRYPYCMRARYGEQDVRPHLMLSDIEFNASLQKGKGSPFVAEESLSGDQLVAYVVDSKCRLVLARRPSGDREKRSELLSRTKLDNSLVRIVAEHAAKAIDLPFAMIFLTMKGNEPVVTGASACLRTVAPQELTGIDLAVELFECFKRTRRRQPIYATREEIRRFRTLMDGSKKLGKKQKKTRD